LEAIYLNNIGTDRNELSFRLCLRLARFLETEKEKRKDLFKRARHLYHFRSRVAHGENLMALEQKETEQLQTVLDDSPRLVANTILKILETIEPLDKKSIKKSMESNDFWDITDFG